MHRPPVSISLVLTAVLMVVLALVAPGCGSDEGDSAGPSKSDAPRDAKPAPPAAGSPEAQAEKSGISSFADTPELEACMTDAGFAEDAPSTGALKAWRHPSGARVAVGSNADVTTGIAAELGTAEAPADVDGTIVLSGPQEQRDAAAACLG